MAGKKQTITTGTISGSPFCAGAAVSVPFTITGAFTSGNIFTAQLSDASGGFGSPVAIGTLTQTTAGTISGTIPANTSTGTGYRIRVVSSTPVITGAVNVSSLTVNPLPAIGLTIGGTGSICSGTSTNITVALSVSGTNYQLRNNSGNVNVGTPVAGTGGTINLPTGNLNSTTTFNVLAIIASTSCSAQLTGTATVTVISLPTATYTLSASPSTISYGATSTLSLSGSETGVNYQLRISTTPVGSAVAGTGSAISFAAVSPASTTTYNVLTTNTTTGCSVQQTSTTTVNVIPTVSFTAASQSSVNESGTMTITAQLSGASGQTVTVPFSLAGTATNTDYTITASPITITAGNTTATITITIVTDALVEPNETVIVTMNTPTNATATGTTVHTATITNDDFPGITVTPTSGLTTTEAGGQATFTVVLNTLPAASVTIGLSTSDVTEGTVYPASLVFTNVNWNVAQTVTVTGVNDLLVDGDIAYTIVTAAATSTDPNYNGMNPSDVSATNTDDESLAAGSIAVNRQSPENGYTPAQLVQNVLVQGCLTASNVTFTGAATQIGHFTSGSSSFPIAEGIILSTGKVADAEGPNNDFGTTTQHAGAGDANINTISGGTSYDAAVLQFDFVPAGNTIQFNYVFASEEYAEFVMAAYNDAFAFLLSGPGITGTKNIALIPSTSTAVAINTIHGQGSTYVTNYPAELQALVPSPSAFGHPFTKVFDNVNGYFGTSPNRYYYKISPTNSAYPPLNASYYVDNGQFKDRNVNGLNGRRQIQYLNGNGASEMEFDGRTTVLTATHAVTACQTYHIKIVIADVNDGKWDSGVFLEGRSFTSNEVQIQNLLQGISGDISEMYEGCEGSYIRFQRVAGADNSQLLTFPIIIAGTAQDGVDFVYTNPSGTIIGDGTFPSSATIPSGQDYVDYYYKAQSDGVIEGNETVIFRVNNSCPCAVTQTYFEKTVTIIDVPQIQTSTVSVIQCTVANPVATITVNMQNGLNPNNYEFKLDNGTFQLSNVFTITSALSDGSDIVGISHFVTVKDKYSCNSITEFNIIIPAIAPFNANAGADINMCEGQSGVQLNGSGGIYYTWTSSPANGTTYLSSTTVANPTVSNTIPAGTTYTFTVTAQDQPGASHVCQGHDDMVLTVNQKPVITVTVADYTVCNATAVQLNAVVTNGGASPSYLWNPTTNLSSSIISNPVYTPAVSSFLSQFFNVTVTGTNGCSSTAGTSAIEVFPSPVITIGTIVNAACGGSNGSATVSASSPGTSPVPTFTYLWDAAAGNQTTATATNLSAGTYMVTVTDATHGCSNTKQVTVGSTADSTPPTAVCQNISVTLDGTGNATIDPADVDNGSSDNCTSIANLILSLDKTTFNASNVGANAVVLTVKDLANNTSTCNATVTVSYSAACNITGTRDVWVEDFSYANNTQDDPPTWTTSINSNNFSVQSNAMRSTNINGAYWLSNTIDISSYTNLNIKVDTWETLNLRSTEYIRFQYSVDGGALQTFANPTGGTYTNDYGATKIYACTNVPNGSTLIIRITVKDNVSPGNHIFDNVHVTGDPALQIAATLTYVTCNGLSNGQIVAAGSGAPTPYQYKLNVAPYTTYQPSGTFTGLPAGTYTITAKDNNSVENTKQVTITQPAADPAITTTLAVSDAASCNPAGGNVIFTITNAQSGVNYELKTTGETSLSPAVTGTGNGGNLNLTILQANVPIPNPIPTPPLTTTTTYKIVATSASGCHTTVLSRQPILTVTTTPPPTGNASQSFCSANSPKVSNLSVTGTGIIWYNLASGGSVVAGTTNLVNGITYYASQTLNFCESPTRLAVTATVYNTPTIISVTHGYICGSGTVVIHASASIGTVNWYSAQTGGTSLGSGNDFTTPNLNTTTSYWVEATNSGCITSTRSEVIATVYALPTIALGANPSVCIGAVTAGLTYSATTGGANRYSIDFDAAAETAGFADVAFTTLPASPISITIPGTATPGTYNANLTVKNSANSCVSNNYPISVTIIALGSWLGSTSTDWNTASNWTCNFIPQLTTNVLISNVANKPILSNGAVGTANNIVIESGSSLTVDGNTLQIAGTITNSGGTFTATAGTVEMKGSAAQTIPASTFATNTLLNLTINNSAGVTLLGPLSVTGIVKVTLLNGDLTTGGNLTLVSTASQTALIDGSGAGSVTGGVTMQRYIDQAYGYKYISSPFISVDGSSFSSLLSQTATIPTFYFYDEDNHRDSLGFNAYQSGWVAKDVNGTLSPMSGYAANFGSESSAKTVSITGTTVNNGELMYLYP